MNFLSELRARLSQALTGLVDDPAPYVGMLKPAQDAKFGDFQANCAMSLKGVLNKPPRDIATLIVSRLSLDDLCEPPEIAGPGFINFRLKTDQIATATQQLIRDDRLGVAPVTEPRTYVVDFSGPNVAKPMHVGHLRSTVIGHALDKILRFLGHTVISDNHVGDWGTQFGMIIYGYKHFRDDAAYQADPVRELARLYRLVNQLGDYHTLGTELPALEASVTTATRTLELAQATATKKPEDKDLARAARKAQNDLKSAQDELASAQKKRQAVENDPALKSLADAHPQIAELARAETAKLHAGDAENQTLWDQFIPQCLAELQKMYARFDLKFDHTLGESHFNPLLAGVVEDLLQRGIATESDGAICVFVDGFAAPFIIRKANGAYTYATTDLATVQYRVKEWQADVILYVVDARQSEHFQQLFATCRKIGFDTVDMRHVSFGTVLGEDNRAFKTRSGDTIGLESLLDEAIDHARIIVRKNIDGKVHGADLSASEIDEIAKVVGIGGIIYADLHHNRDSDYVFSWEKMLAKTGDTATYIQYAYARAQGIFNKQSIDINSLRCQSQNIHISRLEERTLALQLIGFQSALLDVVTDYRPHYLTQYLFKLANDFATFYEECPVLKEADAGIRQSRLLLCDLTARILKKGLELLGIEVREIM
ncbi:arginine--tRNA ligase [bacterium]|nr:arginine--tRNA ligase [bacterium]